MKNHILTYYCYVITALSSQNSQSTANGGGTSLLSELNCDGNDKRGDCKALGERRYCEIPKMKAFMEVNCCQTCKGKKIDITP